MQKEPLFGKTLTEIQAIVAQLGLPKFTSTQIIDWMYKKDVASIEAMSNISARNCELLQEKYELGVSLPVKEQKSIDGTKKYLYATGEGQFIEAAYIPDDNRSTLCVSSQVGCKMGCVFCMTGKQGFQQQLTAGEILNQIRSLPERSKLTNIVYMGMGEPFDNLDEVMKSLEILTAEWGFGMSPRRITVSTIGLIPAMRTFIEQSQCHLAISLHTPFDDERKELMPIQNKYSIKSVVDALKKYNWDGQRRVSFEYIMFKGLNDTPNHVKELTRLLSGLKCRLNLIRFHPIPDALFVGTADKDIVAFRDALTAKGLFTSIRQSRGLDIFAACGLLSTKGIE